MASYDEKLVTGTRLERILYDTTASNRLNEGLLAELIEDEFQITIKFQTHHDNPDPTTVDQYGTPAVIANDIIKTQTCKLSEFAYPDEMPTRAGQTFKGWYAKSSGGSYLGMTRVSALDVLKAALELTTGTPIDTTTTPPTIIVYGQWISRRYTINPISPTGTGTISRNKTWNQSGVAQTLNWGSHKRLGFSPNSNGTPLYTSTSLKIQNIYGAEDSPIYKELYYFFEELNLILDKNSETATGTMNNVTPGNNTEVIIPECTYENAGKQFVSWNTSADGSGDSYSPGESIGLGTSADLTLYAQWN